MKKHSSLLLLILFFGASAMAGLTGGEDDKESSSRKSSKQKTSTQELREKNLEKTPQSKKSTAVKHRKRTERTKKRERLAEGDSGSHFKAPLSRKSQKKLPETTVLPTPPSPEDQIEQLLSLAHQYEYGIDVTASCDRAMQYLEDAVKLGSAEAEFYLAGFYFRAQRWDEGLSSLTNSSLKGHTDAKVALLKTGILLEWKSPWKDLVVLQNRVDLLRRYANEGSASAQNLLGYLYQYGIVVPLDLGEARKWYLLAQENGNPEAVINLDALNLLFEVLMEGHLELEDWEF